MTPLSLNGYSVHRRVLSRRALVEAEWMMVKALRGRYPYVLPNYDLLPANPGRVLMPCHPYLYQPELCREIEATLLPMVEQVLGVPPCVKDSALNVTTTYPFSGLWHRDAEVGASDNVRAMLCLWGRDDVRVLPGSHRQHFTNERPMTRERTWSISPRLLPGDLLLFSPSIFHRGRCETKRLTWLFEFGKTMETVPLVVKPERRFRTLRRLGKTIAYFAIQAGEHAGVYQRIKWLVPRVEG